MKREASTATNSTTVTVHGITLASKFIEDKQFRRDSQPARPSGFAPGVPGGNLAKSTSSIYRSPIPEHGHYAHSQRADEIAGGFQLTKNEVSFRLGAYDKTRSVTIDPVFSFSTHLGGSRSSSGQGIAVDRAGNIYVTGDTNATDFPSAKAAQRKHGGSTDIFVTKLSPDGSRILYSTFIGGSGDDVGYAIAVDSAGSAFITGDTSSTDFPVKNPQQKNMAGMFDAIAFKLSPNGSEILYSTYLGGSQGDRGDAIAIDATGNAYITGYTYSTDFPVVHPIQTAFTDGNVHCFVTKLDATGSTLAYSTYLGGGDDRPEQATGIAVDSGGNAYVTGYTNSAKSHL